MAWVHHLTESARIYVKDNTDFKLPLLPLLGLDDHKEKLMENGHQNVVDQVSNAVTCQIGHEATKQDRTTWEGFPHWPSEVTYTASGYGPYPFWTLGGGSGGDLSGSGVEINTWWSDVLNAERLDHASCNMAGVGASDGVPCTHLFLDDAYAFLFT